jgi:hypothetical protein
MAHWNPGKQERIRLVAGLDGYLEAVASLDGDFHDHRMNARLIQKRGRCLEDAVRHRAKMDGASIVSITPSSNWTAVEQFFYREFLTSPFQGEIANDHPSVLRTKGGLCFQASDLVMFMARKMEPLGCRLVEMNDPAWVRHAGCAVEFERDVLWLTSAYRTPSSASP